jgi:co-chaperonin GroES (HSP10)
VGIPNKINTINRDRERNIFNEKISVGDIVFFHHYAAHEDNLISYNGIDYYFQNYEDLYAVIRNDKIIPLEDWIFVRPLEETDDDISIGGLLIKPNKDIHVRNGQIAYINDYYSKQINVNEGDNIVFEHNSNYPIEINGEMLYRTKVFKVLSKIA